MASIAYHRPASIDEALELGRWPGGARFLVKNDTCYFLPVGEPSGFEFVGSDQVDLSIPDAGKGWDELDFAML